MAVKYLTVKVTKTNIKEGTPFSFTCCPVARALVKLGAKKVWVSGDVVEFTYTDEFFREVVLPARAQSFIVKFDDGKPVKPFSFRLKLV